MNVQIDTPFLIDALGIAIMIYGFAEIVMLRSKVPGGMVGKTWRTLTMLVGLFALGYLATPFFESLPANAIRMFVAIIFLFGAIYVAITVRLLFRIIEELA